MKLLLTFCLVISFSVLLNSQTNIPVIFSVDMGVQVVERNFDPFADIVVIRGSFQDEAGDPGGDWQGDFFTMTDPNTDTIYTLTVQIPNTFAGTNYEFKFVISPDGWEGISNRLFTLNPPSVNLPIYWFNNDSIYNPSVLTNTINFTADISGILGIGIGGAFDPAQDSLSVRGLDWDNLGQNVQGNRTLVQDPFNAGIFTTTLSVTSGPGLTEGDSTKWKFKAYPDSRFFSGGWETGSDRWYIYEPDGSVIDLPVIVPRIWPLVGPIPTDVDITFNVDMSNAVNRYNGDPIDPGTIEFVGMRGGADWLGNWGSGGCWCPDDTLTGLMKVLTHAGNNIWTRSITLPAGTQGGIYDYKYTAMYPGALGVNGGVDPLDNEGPFGSNHGIILIGITPVVLNDVFGVFLPPQVPVELSSFSAVVIGNSVKLTWITATELNNQGFVVQRKRSNDDWKKIAFIQGHGTTTDRNTYEYNDVNLEANSTYQYRLKQVDFDGSFTYSAILEVMLNKPVTFSLEQNYPNPFNPTTTIIFSIPQKDIVSIDLYDILGNKVSNLLNQELEAGKHALEFNSFNNLLSSGVYFYILRAGSLVETKKMILMK